MDQRTVQRVKDEVGILKRETSDPGAVRAGSVRVGEKEYIGVVVPSVAVNPRHFGGVQRASLLFLLPEGYPDEPPIGVYLDRPYDTGNRHFVKNGYHGAETLVGNGWYWLCHAVGGFGLDDDVESRWRPAGRPENGHNLATLLAAARVSLNE